MLWIPRVRLRDGGLYACEAGSEAGGARAEVQVSVQGEQDSPEPPVGEAHPRLRAGKEMGASGWEARSQPASLGCCISRVTGSAMSLAPAPAIRLCAPEGGGTGWL